MKIVRLSLEGHTSNKEIPQDGVHAAPEKPESAVGLD